ncbi:MAG: low-complexity protein [Okeania sp. SIO2C2]|uniref:pentapeptide repeat-containing protein n=1 Tax=Okeania sp. SIO2C2 TaxID=2607787 RepID=UPI0013B7B98F|nr:pentapeptide repeat-containing protein [Okeania sp. SIO2C2]NEP90455.1 low-complexity protein [Okeania sp. SIO2C2]
MATKLWRNIWRVLNTEIELNLSETVKGGVESGKAVLEIAKALQENKDAKELKPFIENIDSVLDVLNSPLGKVAGAGLPFLPIATGIITFIIEKTRQEPTLEDEVQLVAQVAYLESLRQFLIDHPKIQNRLTETEASEAVQKQIKKLDGEIYFNGLDAKDTLICFYDSPLRKKFDKILLKRFKESGLTENNAKIVTERISRNTHRYIKEAVLDVKDNAKKLAGIYGYGWQQDLEVYGSIDKYLKEAIAIKPDEEVFDEKFTFRQIYVPLEVKPVNSDGKVEETATPQNIEKWAKTILLDKNKDKQVLFIQAGPGRGKSLFCRMFAEWVRRVLHPFYTPILIRLRDVKRFAANIDDTLADAVGRDFMKTDSGWLTDRNTRFLFLLDGFDELLLERGASNELKVFLDQVAQFQKQAAENKERGHRVLITGRPLALYGIERLMPSNLERVSILPMGDDIQQKWFEKWQTVVGEAETEKFRDFLHSEQFPEQVKELAREPLLLYLLAAMHRDKQLQGEMSATVDVGGTKVLIYEQALKWVLKKQRGNVSREITQLEQEDLEILLAEAGLCVVQSGSEYAAIKMIEDRLVKQGYKKLQALIENARQDRREDGLKNALAAFYLKSAARAENSVEFFHKSFGEFLCAKRMAESLKDLTEKTERRGKTYVVSDEELEWQVYDLFGYDRLKAEVVEYLMALLVKNQVELVALFERLHGFYLDWCEGKFIEAAEETLLQKKARQLQQWGIESGQRRVDIYTGLNVMILLFELHRYGRSQEELREQLHFYPCGQPEPDSADFEDTKLLKIIGYSNCLGVFAFNEIVGSFLRDADLSGANLRDANLIRADLSGADLSGANLSGADLTRADLSGANLSGANLSRANFIRTDLSGANLINTYLIDANLIRTDLSGANLSGAKLIYANLIDAYLTGADLSSTNFIYANLCRADLIYANLSRADLRSANLIYANLSRADLSGAYLSGAYLSRAYLIRSNLSSADLSDADLSDAYLSNIKWDNHTKWSNTIGLHEAREVPEELQQNPEFAAAVAQSEAASQQQQ